MANILTVSLSWAVLFALLFAAGLLLLSLGKFFYDLIRYNPVWKVSHDGPDVFSSGEMTHGAHPITKRLPPLLSVLVGFFLLFGGFLYCVVLTGFPYVEPTEETAGYMGHAHTASVICWLGVGAILVGFFANAHSRTKQHLANILGIITSLCAVWQLYFRASEHWIEATTFHGGPFFDSGIFFFTLPPALVCTATSLILVGPRNCKLAWIALCTFAIPLAETVWEHRHALDIYIGY